MSAEADPPALDATPLLRPAPRRRDVHKGHCGRVLVVAGARGMVGAAALVAEAALRSGAGLVTVATPASVYPILAAKLTCAMTWPLPETEQGTLAEGALAWLEARLGAGAVTTERARGGASIDAIVLGPGLGRHPETARVCQRLVERSPVPWVADADALWALAQDLERLARARSGGILTPHEGEMARLVGAGAGAIAAARAAHAHAFAQRWAGSEASARAARSPTHTLVLKGPGTLVAEGRRLWCASTGNPGMATGGSGDVLAGVVGALLAQGVAPYEAARLAVHVHGHAGDLAAERLGERSLLATDIIEELPAAWRAMDLPRDG